jgi:hypothetical protein
MIGTRARLRTPLLLLLAVALVLTAHLRLARAQSAPALSDESLLSMVLPPLPDGSRPPVHFWARADQSNGPGGLPTAFVVTLYTHQGAAGADEREVINVVQYSAGAWTPARPQDPGTLLTDDWAWVSLNLVNLSASAQGQGDASQYTVDYDARGNYNGTPRELQIEEIYGSDLSLISSTVTSDTSGPAAAAPTAAAPATPAPVATTLAPAPTPAATVAAATAAAAPAAAVAAATSQPAASTTAAVAPAQPAPNVIRTSLAGADTACASTLSAQGYTWTGATKALGAVSGQPVVVCTADASQSTGASGASFGCLLVGGQSTNLDGSAACLNFATIQPQGDGNFLVVHPASGNSVQVQPIAWGSGGFASGQSYTACLANVAIPVSAASDCTASG